METYDEDLSENPFFQVLQSDHSDLFRKVTVEGWIICIPRLGCVPKYALTHEDFFSHILIPSDELPESHFRTLNDREVRICNRVLTVEQHDITRPFSTHVLFEETFYTEDLRYKVLCIEDPLEQQLKFGCSQSSSVSLMNIHTLRECIDLLWTESAGREVLEKIDELVHEFLAGNENLELEPLGVQKDLVGKLYTQCLQCALRDTRLGDRTTKDKHLLANVKLSVETYMHHGIYKRLIKGITACTAYEDAHLNKIIRNLCDIQLRDLDIRCDLYDTVPWAKQELARIDCYSTVLGKIRCLKRMVASITKLNTRDGNDAPVGMSNIVSADDLLPMIIFLVIKACLPNWVAHLTYMKQFHFCVSSACQVDEHSFLITSLEAAIEHIKSGILIGPSDPEAQILHENLTNGDFDNRTKSFKYDTNMEETSGVTYFFNQIRLSNVDCVKEILQKKANEKNDATFDQCADSDILPKLCHPLCSCDKCESVLSKTLCDTTPTVHSCDDRGFIALHIACLFGHPIIVDILIAHGSNIDATDYSGSTPLHYAALKGHQNALLLLLHSGAAINVYDNDGNTPLHFACNNGHEGCVKALLYFAEHIGVELNVNHANSNGDVPLHHAARWGYENIVQILLEYGAYPGVQNKRHLTPMDYAHNLRISRLMMNAPKATHSSNLWSSLKLDYKSDIAVSAPIKPPLDFSDDCNTSISSVNSLTKEMNTHHVGCSPQSTEQMKQVEKLLRAIAYGDTRLACFYLGLDGPSVSEKISTSASSKDYTSQCHPLCVCEKCNLLVSPDDSSEEEDRERRQILNINVCNLEGFTPLHVASMHGRIDIVRLLLEAGAQLNVCTRSKGVTPLHVACQNQRVQVIQVLLQSGGCDCNIQDFRGNTAVHYACYIGSARILEILLKYNPMLNLKNVNGKTALEEAEEKMSLSLVRLLKGGKPLAVSSD